MIQKFIKVHQNCVIQVLEMQFPVFKRGDSISTCVFGYGKRPKMIAYMLSQSFQKKVRLTPNRAPLSWWSDTLQEGVYVVWNLPSEPKLDNLNWITR